MSTLWSRIGSAAGVKRETGVSFQFRSEVGRIPPAVEQVMRLIRLSSCVRGQEIEVELALYEAVHNAVVHGNRRNPDKWVHVRCGCDPVDGVSIVVRDEGAGFDPHRVSDATAPEWLRADHGLGLLIMRSYMDEVWFEKGGTEVHLLKKPAVSGSLSPLAYGHRHTAQVSLAGATA